MIEFYQIQQEELTIVHFLIIQILEVLTLVSYLLLQEVITLII